MAMWLLRFDAVHISCSCMLGEVKDIQYRTCNWAERHREVDKYQTDGIHGARRSRSIASLDPHVAV